MKALLEWIRDNKGKTIALLIACFYLIFAFFYWDFLKMLFILLIPLGCIFFSDAMGSYTGPAGWSISDFGGPWITKTSPGFWVAFVGWLLLLFPMIVGILMTIFKQ